MYEGVLIAESLRPGTTLDELALTVRRIERHVISGTTEDQPSIWTNIHFEVADAQAGALADALASALDERGGGWYTDLRSDAETVVAFPGHIFRYPRGDASGRAEAQAHGRLLGIPEHQLDWPV